MSELRRPRYSRLLATWIIAAGVCICTDCKRNEMAPLPPWFSPEAPETFPVVLAGEVLQRPRPASLPEISEWTGELVQLFAVKVRVETVLSLGDVRQNEAIDIYYFSVVGGGSFSSLPVRNNLYVGHSELFFLQKDFGKFRCIFDGWRDWIIWVRTGTHYNFNYKANLSIKENIDNLLLSRGDHTTDAELVDAIYQVERRWGNMPIYNALRRLVETDSSPQVRAVAEERLRNFAAYFGSLEKSQPSL